MEPRDEPDDQPPDAVRCVECLTVYRPPSGGPAACPSCGCPTWVSARIPGNGLRPNLGSAG